MKRKFWRMAPGIVLLAGLAVPVQAEEFTGGDWRVAFTGAGMESNFTSSDISGAVYAMQPGDSVTINISLENRGGAETAWYMENKVLSSLEDSSDTASGGAYAYRLGYRDAAGTETVLFDSDSVGGEGDSTVPEGLHGAADSLEEYFLLGSLAPGKSGEVELTVALDGETQGNGYQNTLADLRMSFAAEPLELVSDPGNGDGTDPSGDGGKGTYTMPGSVKTGDSSRLVLWCVLGFVSGVQLLILAILGFRKNKTEAAGKPDGETRQGRKGHDA